MSRALRAPRALRAAGALLLAATLAACAVPAAVPSGATVQQVLASLGAPTGRYPLPEGGERLQYSQLPAGSQVWNLDFDAQGRLVGRWQALAYRYFDQIRIDQWQAGDVQRLLGAPTRVERVARFDGPIWTYRFNDLNTMRFIHVHLDPAGVVRKIQYTDEFTARDRFFW